MALPPPLFDTVVVLAVALFWTSAANHVDNLEFGGRSDETMYLQPSSRVSGSEDVEPMRCYNDDDLKVYFEAAEASERLYTCRYDYAPSKLKMHRFLSHGQSAISCFDLPAYTEETAVRWHAAGCTPFRKATAVVAKVYKCVEEVACAWFPGVEDILQRASKYAWEFTSQGSARKLEEYLRRKVNEVKPAMDEEWWTDNVASDASRVIGCFEQHVEEQSSFAMQQALRCLPALWGRVGFGVGGLRNEGLIYRRDGARVYTESLRFDCQKACSDEPGTCTLCEESCSRGTKKLLLACPRLAVAALAHHMPKRYAEIPPILRVFRNRLQLATIGGHLDWCGTTDSTAPSNCALFTQCAVDQLKKLCQVHPQCCGTGSLEKVPPDEQQEQKTADNVLLAAWKVGVGELAQRQGLFEQYGCESGCVDS